MITQGNSVRIYPHGSPDQAAVGTVIIISGNQRTIAVAFDAMPPFAFIRGGGVGKPLTTCSMTIDERYSAMGIAPGVQAQYEIHPEHGVMFFAYREELGPWIEMANLGHYEIEEA